MKIGCFFYLGPEGHTFLFPTRAVAHESRPEHPYDFEMAEMSSFFFVVRSAIRASSALARSASRESARIRFPRDFPNAPFCCSESCTKAFVGITSLTTRTHPNPFLAGRSVLALSLSNSVRKSSNLPTTALVLFTRERYADTCAGMA